MGLADLALGRMLRISAAYARASNSGFLLNSFLPFALALAIISSAIRVSTSLTASAGATPSW
jgi:hypothetical protein